MEQNEKISDITRMTMINEGEHQITVPKGNGGIRVEFEEPVSRIVIQNNSKVKTDFVSYYADKRHMNSFCGILAPDTMELHEVPEGWYLTGMHFVSESDQDVPLLIKTWNRHGI